MLYVFNEYESLLLHVNMYYYMVYLVKYQHYIGDIVCVLHMLLALSLALFLAQDPPCTNYHWECATDRSRFFFLINGT